MDKKDIIERELNQLDKLVIANITRVEQILTSYRKEEVKLWLTKQDKYKLLTLAIWEKKYKIPMNELILQLVPFWESFVQRRSKKMKKAGLNVRVSTLVGKKSEKVLLDMISKEYPNKEHIDFWVSQKREEIIRKQILKLTDDGIHSKDDASDMNSSKTLIDFSTPGQYLRYYRKKLKTETALRQRIETELRKYTFIDNPFREELL